MERSPCVLQACLSGRDGRIIPQEGRQVNDEASEALCRKQDEIGKQDQDCAVHNVLFVQ